MNILTAEQLNSLADLASDLSGSFRIDYSGRCMYGQKCIGFDLDGTPDMLSLGLELADILGKKAKDLIRSARTDSMGMGIILYFPDWQAPEDYELPE